MIRLYKATETDFTHNEWVLTECMMCEIYEELNGTFTLDLEYPLFDSKGLSKHFTRGAIISAPVGDHRENQLFRIRKIKKNLKSLYIFAQHIVINDLSKNFIRDTNVVGKTRLEALSQILNSTLEKHRFTCSGDVTTKQNQLRIVRYSPLQAILGDDDNTILNRYGGELKFDNFDIKIYDKRGSNNGVVISYGKNIIGIEEELDDTELATRIIPQGANELLLPEYCIDSKFIGNYEQVFHKHIKFDQIGVVEPGEDGTGGVTEQQALEKIRQTVQHMYEVEKVDIVKFNYKIDFIQLSKTEEYKDYAILEDVFLGDEVTVKHSKLNIDLVGRVYSTKFNVLANKYIEIQIGFKPKLITDVINETQKQIQFTKDTIEMGISNLDSTIKADMKIELGKITASVKESNSSNLTRNSVGRLGHKYWECSKHHGDGEVVNNIADVLDNTRNGLQFLIKNALGTKGGLYSHSIPVIEGKEYTITFDLRTHRGTDAWVEVMCRSSPVDNYDLAPDIEKLFLGRTSYGKENIYTFTAPPGTKFINLYIYGEYVDTVEGYPYAHYWVDWLRVNEGKISFPWSESNTYSESEILLLSDEINLKVNKNGIIASINISPEQVKIDANKIVLTGVVSFEDLKTSGNTIINADNIKTGTIDSVNLFACNFRGRNMIYIEDGGTLSCDGHTYIRHLHIPLTHPGWDPAERGSFSCSPNGYFDKDVHVKNEIYARDMGVVGRNNTAFIQINDIGIEKKQGGTSAYLRIAGYQSNHIYGIDVWYNAKEITQPITKYLSNNEIGLNLINTIEHVTPATKTLPQVRYNFDKLPDDWTYNVAQADDTLLKHVSVQNIIPHITLAIQQQQTQIDQVKKENEHLKKRLTLIENKLGITI